MVVGRSVYCCKRSLSWHERRDQYRTAVAVVDDDNLGRMLGQRLRDDQGAQGILRPAPGVAYDGSISGIQAQEGLGVDPVCSEGMSVSSSSTHHSIRQSD